jgi:hypothetical protein
MKLTAKEYAKELFEKYMYFVPYTNKYRQEVKFLAKSAVDECIKYAETFGDVTLQDVDYFNGVKKEIDLL